MAKRLNAASKVKETMKTFENEDSPLKPNAYTWKFEEQIFIIIKRNAWIFFFIAFLIVPALCFIPYFLTVRYKQAYPILPFLSDNGGRSPGANVMSQLIDVCGLFVLMGGWARYKQVKYYLTVLIPKHTKNKDVNNPKMLNWLLNLNFQSFFLTIFVVLGCFTTGNFRNTEMIWSHVFGAMTLFTAYLFYNIYQIVICWQLCRCENLAEIESAPTSMIVFCILDWMAFFTFGALMPVAVRSYDSMFIYWNHEFRMFWSPDMEGYVVHVFSAAAEWIAILLWSPFFFMMSKRAWSFKYWDELTI